MKSIIEEYLHIIGFTITGLVFGLAFFLLFVNLYHSKEVGTVYTKSDSDSKIVTEISENINKINSNIQGFDMNTYRGREDIYSMASVKSRLELCVKQIEKAKILKVLEQPSVSIQDVYDLQQDFQATMANDCLVKQLYDLTVTDGSGKINIYSLPNFAPFFKNNIDNLIVANTYLQNDIKNNSSYFFSTDTSKINILNPTKDSYYQVVGTYRRSVEFVAEVSSWYQKVVGGAL